MRAIRTKELSTKLLLLQFKSSLRNGRSTRKYTSFEGFISPPKALPSALLSKIPCLVHCSQQNYHFFFKNLLHPNRSRIDISASPRFIKRADKGAQTYPCFQKQDSPAHSQQISLLPHSSGLYLPTPLRYNGFGPFSPQPVIVSVGCNGLLTGLGWGNFVAGLYSEVPNLPLRKKREQQMQES